jgi:hypothetical protein
VVLAGLAVTFLGACGNSSSAANSPQAVQSALHATATQSGLQLILTLQGRASAYPSDGNSSGGNSGNGNSSLTQAQKQAILNSQLALTVVAAKGTTLYNAGPGGSLALALSQGGTTYLEVREVGTPPTLYARVDIDKLTSAYGLDKGSVARFRSQLEKLGSQVGGLTALDKGQWVSVNVNLVNQFASAAGLTLPSLPQLVARVVGAFFNTLGQSTNIQPGKAGQAQVTVNAQALVTALAQAAETTPGMSSLSKQTNGLSQRAHNAVPADKSGTVTVTVSDGIASNLALSLNQFDTSHQFSGPASANLAVSKSTSVSAPSGAVPINIPQLLHAFQGTPSSS